jgi:hypothetical protein
MNRRVTRLLAVVILSVTPAQIRSTAAAGAQRSALHGQLPEGWGIPDAGAGSVPEAYEVGVDRMVKRSGNASAYIKAVAEAPRGFMALTQGFQAGRYHGRRLRFAVYIRTQGVTGRAGLWVQIGGGGGTVGFDNMSNRPVKGTTDWAPHEVVLDVPENAVAIAFGFLLSGPGQAWVDDMSVDVVEPDVPVTNMTNTNRTNPANVDAQTRALANIPTQPENLGFERLSP